MILHMQASKIEKIIEKDDQKLQWGVVKSIENNIEELQQNIEHFKTEKEE